MDLHNIVRGAISTVNPDEEIEVRVSAGASPTNADGSRDALFNIHRGVTAQVQPVDGETLEHLDALNLQGTMRSFYIHGDVAAIVRARGKGGDVIARADGSTWLVSQVIEQWPDWCHVIGTLQNGG